MTVRELIQELRRMPADSEVLVPANPGCNCLLSPDHLISITNEDNGKPVSIVHCLPLLEYFRASRSITHLMLAEEWERFFIKKELEQFFTESHSE